jgi:hypothetical protein
LEASDRTLCFSATSSTRSSLINHLSNALCELIVFERRDMTDVCSIHPSERLVQNVLLRRNILIFSISIKKFAREKANNEKYLAPHEEGRKK